MGKTTSGSVATWSSWKIWGLALGLAALLLSGCGDSDSDSSGTTAEGAAPTDSAGGEDGALPNACPADGCAVSIEAVAASDSGDELEVTFDANFTPDFERNHIHVFWASQEPGAVSSDFAERGFETQGKWNPTADYPTYTTQEDVSVNAESRAGSTQLCVTASDGAHAVINDSLFSCTDVADLLP
jgi:hypothetical protein